MKMAFNGLKQDLLLAFLAILAFIAVIPVFTYVYFANDLTSKDLIMNRNNTGITLTDKNGVMFFTFYQAKHRSEIPLSDISKATQQAVIAMEDKDFYTHPGFSVKSMFRSLVADLRHQELAQGGSTITQQLVKNALLTPKKEFLRKYQEIVLAEEIERRYSKEEILGMYLNSVYFGQGAFGIQEAAKIYFNKDAKDLNLAQSAQLAALLPAPNKLSPVSGDAEAADERQDYVLQKMYEQGYITEEEKVKAAEEKLVFDSPEEELNSTAPHFALMVRDELIRKYGEEFVLRSGFKVRTTLNLEWQRYAEEVVAKQVENLKGNKVSNGAAVVIDPINGEIRALVGSKNWFDEQYGKVNIALSERPPGSSFKPVVYLDAFEKKLITPSTVLKDQPTAFKNFDEAVLASYSTKEAGLRAMQSDPNAYYKPQNYDRKFRGPLLPRRALSNSLNVPAVEVMEKVGVKEVLDYSKKVGLTTLGDDPANYGLSLVLGTGNVKLLELTNFYATLANKGQKNEPTTIIEILDKGERSIYKHSPNPTRVAGEQETFLISSILSDNKARTEMFGNALTISRPAAVKTGTTEDYKDAWTLGYTPSLVVGVWVGNNFGEPMDRVAGSLGAAPIWKLLMEKFHEGTPIAQFEAPQGMVKLAVCPGNGLILKNPASTSSAQVEYFLPGTQPNKYCNSNPSPAPSAQPQQDNPQPSTTPEPQKEEKKEEEIRLDDKERVKESRSFENGEEIVTYEIQF